MGRRTISQTMSAKGGSAEDWSADYKLYSRSRWDEQRLFGRTSEQYMTREAKGPVVLAMDDTRLPKSGKKIPGGSWQRDPWSPTFQVNLMWELRFLQGSLLFTHHSEGDFSDRAYPDGLKHVPVVKKPGMRASERATQAKWGTLESNKSHDPIPGLDPRLP